MKPYAVADAEAEVRAAMVAEDWPRVEALGSDLDSRGQGQPPGVLAAALWYAEQGLHVFPIQERSKVPHPGTNGCKMATTDLELLMLWWVRWPLSNVAIATGHVVDVLDFDSVEAHAAWGERYPLHSSEAYGTPVLGTVSTPRVGGLHVYIAATGEGNHAGLAGTPVDYRGAGGYVVAPPSVTEAGSYRWLRPPVIR